MRSPHQDIDRRIGDRVRDLRVRQGLTLDALAHQAEVSRAMLSRIERGESSPTAQLLNRVCGGLGLTLSALFAEPDAPANPLARRADQPTWRDPATRYLRRNVSPAATGSQVEIAEIELPPGACVGFENDRVAGQDQHVWVLEGALDLEHGDEVVRLERGDCLWMRFGRPVTFRNPTERPVRYAVVVGRGGPRP